ncbi:PREDICTED: uncharacterized protein LOC105146718 [Acromyrmex echinatior]|uniref:uncharacterized protein LOC105146718 n=1 Tax=Acromyrmex echinatior TaxID=103372 RepID=UPI000580FC83|nr:PREDICTED: uncharacterized protein LOC105146718 [Acromyrmex echinatior]
MFICLLLLLIDLRYLSCTIIYLVGIIRQVRRLDPASRKDVLVNRERGRDRGLSQGGRRFHEEARPLPGKRAASDRRMPRKPLSRRRGEKEGTIERERARAMSGR